MKTFGASRVMLATIWIVAMIAVGSLAGCASGSMPAAASTGLAIENAFARAAPAGGNGGAFLTVVNSGSSTDRLVGARSAVAPTMELHETIDDNGMMKMRPVPAGFEIPAKGRLELKPGGKHVMFIGLTAPLVDGEEVEITLVFEKAGEITVKAPIQL